MTSRLVLVATLLLLAAPFIGCRRKAGDACSAKESFCSGAQEMMMCAEGRWTAGACRGPLGCAEILGEARCDTSGNATGDACVASPRTQARCAAGGGNVVLCRDGRTAVVPCTQCLNVDERPSVCTGPPNEGHACEGEATIACSADGKLRLSCKEGRWGREERCEAGCDATVGPARCIARTGAGAPCAGRRGATRCTKDGTTLLDCVANRWEVGARCSHGCGKGPDGPDACKTPADEGTPCPGHDGEHNCTTNGAASVVCRSGTWKLDKTCAGGCDTVPSVYGMIAYCVPPSAGAACPEFSRFKVSVIATCSADARSQVACEGGRWNAIADCKGGCRKGVCSPGAGDRCGHEGDTACLGPGEAGYCERGRWQLDRVCLGSLGCTGPGACDVSKGRAGAPCGRDWSGTKACAEDGRSVLVCREGTWEKGGDCPAACKPAAGGGVACE